MASRKKDGDTNSCRHNCSRRSSCKIQILDDGLNEEEYVIGFRKGDQILRDKVQSILARWRQTEHGEISTKGSPDVTTVDHPTTLNPDAKDDSLRRFLTQAYLFGLDASLAHGLETNCEIRLWHWCRGRSLQENGRKAEKKGIEWSARKGLWTVNYWLHLNGMSVSEELRQWTLRAHMDNKMVFVVPFLRHHFTWAAQGQEGSSERLHSSGNPWRQRIRSWHKIVALGTNVEASAAWPWNGWRCIYGSRMLNTKTQSK